jgi:hypothetical protein
MSGDNGLAALLEAFGVGDKSVATDRRFQLAGLGNLENLASRTGQAGGTASGDALAYLEKLLSGNRSAVTAAVAPTTNAAAGAAAAKSRQISATGTARGGGTNAEQQQTSDSVDKATQDAINAAVPGAAGTLGTMGTNLLSQSGSDSSALASQAGQTRTMDQMRSDELLDALTKMFSATDTGKAVSAGITGI